MTIMCVTRKLQKQPTKTVLTPSSSAPFAVNCNLCSSERGLTPDTAVIKSEIGVGTRDDLG
jgi:hypothetical protein